MMDEQMLNTADYVYDLPEERIAQTPIEPRDHSRLLVYHRSTGEMEHRHFFDLVDYLREGDALVINDTRVLPARLLGIKMDTGGKMEFLLLKRLQLDEYEVLSKPARRAKVGTRFSFGNGVLQAEVTDAFEDGIRHIRFTYHGSFEEALEQAGSMPLPPYIHEKLRDPTRYQTVYSQHNGSAAAPTAGLHFTKELLQRIRDKGVEIVPVLLHVGLGTFRPVNVERITDHVMHREQYALSHESAATLNRVRERGGRIIAVGTTSTRVLETVADAQGHFAPQQGDTQIFIYPGYQFHGIDAQITNFHLPKSTLLMMMCALAGREEMLRVYQTAVEMEYRFFSFGDAMLIL